ncbi:MAG TPA: ABC transporter ATP-binding protein [Candidatus Sulfotelmatobacter sp.]|jgi:putative spermidine/putrescine transport system ATP-binding protein|nr:ABC transporter ATP-binding protein [Candidatus Sulfotelmatobacter sp.]
MVSEQQALVQFSQVQKTYDGETLVVKHLDLDIQRGEFLTLLGPSGSGKTTTLMMLAGFEVPTHGEIKLAGKAITSMPPHKRNIGMVFQNYALFPHMTVAQNVAFPLEVRKLPKAEIAAKVKKALEMVKLDHLGQRRPTQMSGGQQQRVALARALVFEPELILMDEPLGALDKQLREHMQMEIKHLHSKLGLTVVYVTHDQSEALTMSDRVAVFNEGVIQQIDAPNVLYEEPKNSFVANFIGENNNLDGEVTTLNGDTCTVRLDDGTQVEAAKINVWAEGARTTLSIRPERLFVGDASSEAPNKLIGSVVETIYLGDHLRVIVRLSGGTEIMVKEQASPHFPMPRPGDSIPLSFRTEDCRALNPVSPAGSAGGKSSTH